MQTIHRNTVAVPAGTINVEGNDANAVKAVSDALSSVAKVPFFSGLMLARSIQSENDSVSARFVKTRVAKAKTAKVAKK